jgi:hypothetical protein
MGDIQGGGSCDEQPVHSVYVKQFAIGNYNFIYHIFYGKNIEDI